MNPAQASAMSDFVETLLVMAVPIVVMALFRYLIRRDNRLAEAEAPLRHPRRSSTACSNGSTANSGRIHPVTDGAASALLTTRGSVTGNDRP